jgi:hypothetical protein
MPRLSVLALVVAAAILSVACADNVLKPRQTAKAVGTAAAKPAFSAVGSAKGESSVCAAYRRQLRVVQLRQAATQVGKSNADQLKARELSLNAIIADSCE